MCILKVQAGKEHYENDKHNAEFDQTAFLGQEEAARWKKLPTYEVKQKLKQLFPKIDINHDKKVSEEELYEWIEPHIKKHVLRRTDTKMKGIDTNNDGKVSWEEFKVSRYPPSMEKGLHPEGLRNLREVQKIDKRKFDFADKDKDGQLLMEELSILLHPEESHRMISFLVQETLDMFDTNKDGKVSLQEYMGDEPVTGEVKLKSFTRTFTQELDGNRDGFLDRKEIQKWTLPGTERDPVQYEVDHMMKLGDDNKDGFLEIDELVRHHRDFAGSRVTKYGELLKEEL